MEVKSKQWKSRANTRSFESGLCTPKNEKRVLGDPASPALKKARGNPPPLRMTELGLIARLYKIRECQRNDFPKGCTTQPLLENALSALIRPQGQPATIPREVPGLALSTR